MTPVIKKTDYDELAGIYRLGIRLCVGPDWTPDAISDVLAGGMGLSFTAMIKKEIAGFLIASPDGERNGRCAIKWIAASDDYGGAVIEEMLLRAFLAEAEAAGYAGISVEVACGGRLNELFLKFGFTEGKKSVSLAINLGKKP